MGFGYVNLLEEKLDSDSQIRTGNASFIQQAKLPIMKTTMMMSLLVLFCLLGLAQTEQMTISGEVTGFEDSSYLYLAVSKGDVGTTVDSVMILNSHFELSYHLPETPNVIYLAGKNFSPYVKIWADNVPMTFKGDRKDFSNSEVKGSPINDIARQFASNRKNETKQLELIRQYIDSEPAIHSLYFLKEKLPKEELQELAEQIPESLADYRFTKRIHSYLEASDQKPPEVGDPIVDFEAFDADGKTYRLSELNDRHILLEFGSSFCGPCFFAAPELSELQEKESEQLRVISFSIDSREDNWRSSLERLAKQEKHAHILHLWDGEGQNGKIPVWYDVQGIPVFFLINPEGTIVDKWVGYEEGIVKSHWTKVQEMESNK